VHADGESQPIKEVRKRIVGFQLPDWHERSRAEEQAQRGVDHKWPYSHEKIGSEIIGAFMQHIARRIAEAEKANVEDRQPVNLAENKMRGFMHNHSGEREQRNHGTWNKEHG
jgi:hypothetical protein